MKELILSVGLLLTLINAAPTMAQGLLVDVPDKNLAQFVVEHLDMRSFPSSLSFRSNSNGTTFADYGIQAEKISENKAVLTSKNKDWKFEIQVIRHDKNSITICLHDVAQKNSSFNYESILLLKETGGTMLIAAKNPWIAGGY